MHRQKAHLPFHSHDSCAWTVSGEQSSWVLPAQPCRQLQGAQRSWLSSGLLIGQPVSVIEYHWLRIIKGLYQKGPFCHCSEAALR